MKKIQFAVIALLTVAAPARSGSRPQSRLDRYVGVYRAAAGTPKDCPSTLTTQAWVIDVPVIDVLNVSDARGKQLASFEDPAKPSVGYPTNRSGDAFSIRYIPAPESSGPYCGYNLAFSAKSKGAFAKMTFVQDCPGAKAISCSYERLDLAASAPQSATPFK